MIKGLYEEIAKRWYRGGNIWLYSDPHFSDAEMVYLRKDYIGDEEQIRRINAKVGKNDTFICLGDVGNLELVKRIKGYKVLIMGNHDEGSAKRYLEAGFNEVYEGYLTINPKIILSHEPADFPYAFNIHGHDHSDWYPKDGKHLNVCAEHIDYTPISLITLLKTGVASKIEDIHRATIDNATERKFKKGK